MSKQIEFSSVDIELLILAVQTEIDRITHIVHNSERSVAHTSLLGMYSSLLLRLKASRLP